MSETTRRGFLHAATGAAAVAGATGTAAGQEGGTPDWGGWLSGVDGGFTDARGESEVTVEVGASGNGGNFAFAPAGLWVDPGTTVRFEWTGQGSSHNVVTEEGPADLNSDLYTAPGVNYEYTFEEGDAGITTYYCEPHIDLGMQGAVAVGGDVPTTGGGGSGGPSLPDEAKTLGVASTGGLVAVLGLAYVFLKYSGGGGEVE
jgi:halocyanin-like protein